MPKHVETVALIFFVGGILSLSAGEFIEEPSVLELPHEDLEEGCRFCDALKGIAAPVYKKPENPFIQEFKFRGRTHYQWAYVNGSSNGDDFEGSGGELRRFWGGVKFKAFNHFDVLATGRFSEQGFRNHDIQYNEVDFLSVDYRLPDLGPLTKAKIGYGRYRMDFGREWHISVNRIKTPERAPVFDRFIQARATGVRFQGDFLGLNFKLNYFTTDDSTGLASWNGGEAFHFATSWKGLGGEWFADGYVLNADAEEDELLNYDKAFSLAYEWKAADWTMFVNGVWGDLGDEEIWGVVGMAHRMVYKDKIEAVLRYQYAGATGEELRVGGRAARGVASVEDVTFGLGDVAQNAYAGLNFYGCGLGSKFNSTLLVGVEWDKVSGGGEDFESFTFWTNYRFFF